MFKKYLFSLFMFAVANHVFAQNLNMLTSARVTLSYNYLGKQQFENSSQSFDLSQSGLSLNLPLYHTNLQQSEYENKRFFYLGFQPSIQLSSAKFSNVMLSRTLINMAIGVNGIYYSGKKNMYFASLKPMLNEDEYTINYPVWRYNASLLFSRKVNQNLSYRLGLAYSYIFGDAYLLPILGASYRFNTNNRLHINLPFNITYRHIINSTISFSIYTKPNGSMNRYANRNVFDSSYNTILFRRINFLLGANAMLRLRQNLRMVAGLAVSSKQQLRFTQDTDQSSDSYYTAKVKPTYYVSLSLVWFPFSHAKNKKKMDKNTTNDTEDFLNDEIFFQY